MQLSASSTSDDVFDFENIQGKLYTTTIHINGQSFKVDMDTGSSDLWIDTKGANLTGTTDTGILGAIVYEDLSSAVGNLTLADITWGNFTVKDQVFISAPGTNATLGLRDGLLGLGPQTLSNISHTLHLANSSVNGATLLDNIFSLYPDEPNHITFLLTRDISGIVDGGDFTIGEIVDGFEAISAAPKLPVVSNRWLTFVDAMIVNEKRVTAPSAGFPNVEVPKGKLTAIFDTGISLDIAPKTFVDAMFKDVPGAFFDEDSRLYVVPCDTKLNVSLVAGDIEYPIHPVDLVSPIALNGSDPLCVGGFMATDENTAIGDFQFGDVVLRNLYTLFDYGNWSRAGDGQPFIQILSLTDADKAFAEFDTMQSARVEQFLAANSDDSSTSASSVSTSTSSETAVDTSSATTTASSLSPASPVATSTIPLTSVASTSVPPTTVSALATSTGVGNSKDFAAGAVSDNNSISSTDLNNLIRNSYIVIGLLGFAIVLLIGVVVMTSMRMMAPRGGRYKPIIPPVDDHASTPYRYSD
ncbi:unnamed protein product [Somion occarium]